MEWFGRGKGVAGREIGGKCPERGRGEEENGNANGKWAFSGFPPPAAILCFVFDPIQVHSLSF